MKQRIVMVFSVFLLLFSLNNIFATPDAQQNTTTALKKRTPPLVFFASTSKPVVTISLDANPSTGYQWYMKDTQSYLVDAVSYSYQQASEKPALGQGGQAVWKLSLDAAAFEFPQRIDVCFLNKGPGTSSDNITKQRVWIFTSPISDNTE